MVKAVGKTLKKKEYDCFVRMFQHSMLKPIVSKSLNQQEKLVNIFRVIVTARQYVPDGKKLKGLTKSERNLEIQNQFENIVRKFEDKIIKLMEQTDEFISMGKIDEAHQNLLKELVSMKGVGQKIANEYLKQVVRYFGKWKELEHVLHLPIDSRINRIFTQKLKLVDVKRLPTNIRSKTYIKFQEELHRIAKEIGVHSIVYDNLWFAEKVFCQKLPLCSSCWIRLFCQDERNDFYAYNNPI